VGRKKIGEAGSGGDNREGVPDEQSEAISREWQQKNKEKIRREI